LERRKSKAPHCVAAQDEIDRGIAEVAKAVVKNDWMIAHLTLGATAAERLLTWPAAWAGSKLLAGSQIYFF